jgi:ABC-type multidrug transport system fused ATPase/permease subunit
MFVRGVVSIIISLVILFYISWLLTVALIACLLPLMLLGTWYGKKIKILSKSTQDKVAECNTVADESFTHIRIVKALSTEKILLNLNLTGIRSIFHLFSKSLFYFQEVYEIIFAPELRKVSTFQTKKSLMPVDELMLLSSLKTSKSSLKALTRSLEKRELSSQEVRSKESLFPSPS